IVRGCCGGSGVFAGSRWGFSLEVIGSVALSGCGGRAVRGAMVGVRVSGCGVCFFKLRRGWGRGLSQGEGVMFRSVCVVLV
ncbi:hypothetical protein FG478_00425, partial [Xylella fastidiosa subsp. multiplex]|nr:hypothetical protein [Xylella fastidiosa subsp. multiplex]